MEAGPLMSSEITDVILLERQVRRTSLSHLCYIPITYFHPRLQCGAEALMTTCQSKNLTCSFTLSPVYMYLMW